MRHPAGGEAPQALARGPLREALRRTAPEPIIELLEPLVTTARRERIRTVLARRLDSVTVVLDSLHDPHNGAAVVRSCDAFGVATVHALEQREPFVAARTVAKGAEHWVEVVGHRSPAELSAAMAASAHRLVAAHPEGEMDPSELATVDRVALVLGNEHAGIGSELLRSCRGRVRVPMRGFVESLNVSVTAAVLLAAATAHRPGDLPPSRQRRLYAEALVHSVSRAPEILMARGIALEWPPGSSSAGGSRDGPM